MFVFEEHGGQTTKDHKPHWPHKLAVQMCRKDALHLLSHMANQLEHEDNSHINIYFVGKMTEEEDQ